MARKSRNVKKRNGSVNGGSARAVRRRGRGGGMRVTYAPVASGIAVQNRAASGSLRAGSSVVRHREFLTEVAGSAEFAWEQHVINPGLIDSFPWLSAIANRYETYRFRSLRFEYLPRVSSTTSGAVTLVFDYDPADYGPASLSDAMSYSHSSRGSCWQTIEFVSKAGDRDSVPKRYTRDSSPFAQLSDARLSDLGSLFICTDSFAGANPCGEVFVDYEVELFTPQMPSTGAEVPTSGVLEHLPTSTLEKGILNGVDATQEEMRTSYGINGTLVDGVLTFLGPFTGSLFASCKSASAPGNWAIEGGKDPALGAYVPQALSTALTSVTGGAGTAGVYETLITAEKGSKLRLKVANAVAASAASIITLSPIAMDVFYKLTDGLSFVSLSGL